MVALGFLYRDGSGPSGRYRNTEATDQFLDKNQPEYIGSFFVLSNDSFKFWSDLESALKTGKAQNETKHGQKSLFESLNADTDRLEQFINGMSGLSRGNFQAFAAKFDFAKYKTLCDVGGASGLLSELVAKQHPHIHCLTFDMPQVEPIAKRAIERAGLTDRVRVVSGDFFTDVLPTADVIVMGMILHDWNLEKKETINSHSL